MKTKTSLFSKAILLSILCLGLSSLYVQAANNVPTVTAISPNSGPVACGTHVIITGNHFSTSETKVNFGKEAAVSFVVVSPTEISAIAPEGTGTVDVTVTTPKGTSKVTKVSEYEYKNSKSGL